MNVLVTGGTGALGRHVVMQLRQSGHRARIFSRHTRGHVDAMAGDLRTGEGVARALVGMEVVVHAASATRDLLRGRATDVAGTRRMLEFARTAGVRHVVFISIVGIDAVDYPYYRTKVAAEEEVRDGGVAWTILRATQFHEFIEVLLRGFSRMPRVTAIPFDWRYQPVETAEVARRLVDIALGEPAGMLADFGGPEVRDFKSLAVSWLRARKESRRLINLRMPFAFDRQVAEGKLTCPDHRDGVITFEQHLEERYALV